MISRSASPLGTQNRTKFFLTVATVAFALSIVTPAYSGNGNGNGNSQGSDNSSENRANSRSEQNGPPSGPASGGSTSDEGSSSGSSLSGGSSSGSASSSSSSDELKRPPNSGSSSSNDSADDESTSFFSPTPRTDKYETKFRRAQKELARLFVLSEREIQTEFPGGGFDDALVRAADRARRAERAYQRNSS